MADCGVHEGQVLPLNLHVLALDSEGDVLDLDHNLFVISNVAFIPISNLGFSVDSDHFDLEKLYLVDVVLFLVLNDSLDLVHLSALRHLLRVREDVVVHELDVQLHQLPQREAA